MHNWQQTALAIHEFFGMTVIPAREKRPLVRRWKPYQERTVPPRLFDFSEAEQIGLVLQAGWLVVDLDSQERIDEFKALFPPLWETLREHTPRGMHLWFRAPPSAIKIKHSQQVDVLTAGSFVVVAPSPGYRFEQSTRPLLLNQGQCRRLLNWLERTPTPVAESPPDAPLTKSCDLRRVYRSRLKYGRNNALSQAAWHANGMGVPMETVMETLVDLHVTAPPPAGHRPETPQQRRSEAVATIQSAYRKPAHPPFQALKQLPAEALQKLHRLGLKSLARALVACYARSLTTVTRTVLTALTTDWVARQALKARLGDRPVFQKGSPHPSQKPAALVGKPDKPQKTNEICRVAKPPENRRGRPPVVFTVPTIEQVCRWLEVKYRVVDEISTLDVQSPSDYGAALIRGLIGRNQGQKGRSTAWQAGVFGVSPATIRRWRRRAGIMTVNKGVRVTRQNFDHFFPDEERRPDHWLQDASGRKYPAQRVVAARIMSPHLTYHTRQDYVFYVILPKPQPPEPPRLFHWNYDRLPQHVPQSVPPPEPAPLLRTFSEVQQQQQPAPEPLAVQQKPKKDKPRYFYKPFWKVFARTRKHHVPVAGGWRMGECFLTHDEYDNLSALCEGFNTKWERGCQVGDERYRAGYDAFQKARAFLHDAQWGLPHQPKRDTPLEDPRAEKHANDIQQIINRWVANSAHPERRLSLRTVRGLFAKDQQATVLAYHDLLAQIHRGRTIRNPAGWFITAFRKRSYGQ